MLTFLKELIKIPPSYMSELYESTKIDKFGSPMEIVECSDIDHTVMKKENNPTTFIQ